MKTIKQFSYGMLFLIALGFTSCEKDEDPKDEPQTPYECASCMDSPMAKAAFDGNSGGIYKGVVIGSSGTILFDINNSGTEVTATLTLDGDVITLTSSVTWVNGASYLAPFTGTYNGQPISIEFSVDASGQNPYIVSSDIPGHPNASFTIAKETSTMLVEGFEGTYHSTYPEDGTFNILLSRDLAQWGGSARENGSSETKDISGSINSSNELIDDESGYTIGVLATDEINGSFVDSEGSTITVHGVRTL